MESMPVFLSQMSSSTNIKHMFSQNSNSVSECVCFFHGMGSEQYRAVRNKSRERLPHIPLSKGIHPAGGLVEEEDFGVAFISCQQTFFFRLEDLKDIERYIRIRG